MPEAQSYKMSLEPSSFPAAGITGSKGSLQQTRSEASSQSHKTRDSQALVSENRSKVSNKSEESRNGESHESDKSASTRHTSTVHTMSSNEKRHELALVKRRHEELERQYHVSLRLNEQENRLKFEQSHSSKDHLPEWNLVQFDAKQLNWHELFGQFKSTVDSAVLTDDTKLTYLKTLVTGKAKTTIAEFSYSGVMYNDTLATLQRKFGQPHAIVGAHLDKLNTFPPLKTHKRAKYVAQQKLCFACLNGNHSFRQCSRAKKCSKPECDSTHNVLLHGAEIIFPRKENSNVSKKAGISKAKEKTNTSTHSAVSDVHDIESSKELLPIATLAVSSDINSLLTLVLCDSASTHSCVLCVFVTR